MSRKTNFNPSRLTFARERRGFTKTQLAEKLGVDLRSITGYESGEFNPDEISLQKLGRVLRFPKSFFFGDDLEKPLPDTASFRSMSKMTAAQRNIALGQGAIALLLNEWIEKWFELPVAQLPDLRDESTPEAAAESLRQIWGLGVLPVKNMIHLLESKGVRVFSLAIDAREVDAFSLWRGQTPFILLNTQKSSEHSRFDAAHELAHLVLHRHGEPQGQEAEKEAHEFAAAFLMPRTSVLAQPLRFATVDHLVKLKKYWTVSVAALAYRLHRLQFLTDWHYRTLCIQIAKRGYRTREPEEAARESSQVLAKVFAAMRKEGIGKSQIAEALNVYAEDIDELVFGLALTGLSSKGAPTRRGESRRPQLRVISSKD
jgi:Zn-dependent peptidase ImmA (M78 family)/DNA-binding XRE family transcriptional regulator